MFCCVFASSVLSDLGRYSSVSFNFLEINNHDLYSLGVQKSSFLKRALVISLSKIMKSPPRHRFGEVADRGKSATIRHLYDGACALTQVKANEQKLPCQSNR